MQRLGQLCHIDPLGIRIRAHVFAAGLVLIQATTGMNVVIDKAVTALTEIACDRQ